MLNSNLPLLILIFPLIGFLLNGVVVPLFLKGFNKTPAVVAGSIGSLAIFGSFVCSIIAFLSLGENSSLDLWVFDWLNLETLKIGMNLKIDHLSMIMSLVVSGVGFLIHVYSIGYMSHDQGVGRFFAYLNLFCFAMMLLVLADDLPILFFGWEGVGLCSYLLIGFWYTDPVKATHGKKAFLVNRVGDLGFLLGMFILYGIFKTLNISAIREITNLGNIDLKYLALALGLLFVGATGKSAQIPLYVWLPDAMSGPTPVSALIHAATMVTAGVYMLVRLNFLYVLTPDIMQIVATIGGATALFAGTIGIAQNDIKKVLAYSTVSQLGYMFMAVGVGAFGAAIFHLVTHAFFKALLFLGSGSVIHACSGVQDMTKMGGLKKYLPHTFWTMMIGSLSLSGIPLFCGFFSKDEILYSAIAMPGGSTSLFIVGVVTAFITAIYTGRMMSMTFLGKERFSEKVRSHLHESPFVMVGPLYVLAVLAIIGGFIGVPHILGESIHLPNFLAHYLDPIVAHKELPGVGIHLPLPEMVAMLISVVLGILGLTIGMLFFRDKFHFSDLVPSLSPIKKLLSNKYYIDEIYQMFIIKPLEGLSLFCKNIMDRYVIDGLVNTLGRGAKEFSGMIRQVQTGDIRRLSLFMIFGLFAFVLWAAKFIGGMP
jgi:NADH-quinone oxidoreductase subunit L